VLLVDLQVSHLDDGLTRGEDLSIPASPEKSPGQCEGPIRITISAIQRVAPPRAGLAVTKDTAIVS